MTNQSIDDLVIKESDCDALSQLAESARSAVAKKLEDELARATILEDAEYPPDAVCMGAVVSFVELASGNQGQLTLVYPWQANLEAMKISVLTPMGCALIGLRVGGVIDWPMPNGQCAKIKVLAVVQPVGGDCQ